MPTTIYQLDDLCLLLIFDELSICDLFRAGRVCVWWNAIRSKSANGRKELTLLIGRDAQRYINEALFLGPESVRLADENAVALIPLQQKQPQQSDAPIQVESLSVDFARFLYDNLQSNLTTLTISCHLKDKHHNYDTRSVTFLLERFSSTGQLHTLKLFTDSMNEPLQNALNSIGTIKKLQLDLSCVFQFKNFDLPILGQLEEFDFYGYSSYSLEFNDLKNSIMRYGVENKKLTTIRIIDFGISDFAWMLSLPRDFASRFKQLRLDTGQYSTRGPPQNPNDLDMALPVVVSRLEEVCRHFHNVTSLELSKYLWGRPITHTQLFTSLSHLPNLLSLTMDTLFIMQSFPSVVELKNFETIPTFPSVRMLTFRILNFKFDHEKFANLNAHHYFPNVDTVRLIRCRAENGCTSDCALECNSKFYKSFKLPDNFPLLFCTLRMTKTLTKFQQLKSVRPCLNGSFLEWSVKDIQEFAENEINYFSNRGFLNFSKKKDKATLDCVAMTNVDSDSENVVASTSNQNLDVE